MDYSLPALHLDFFPSDQDYKCWPRQEPWNTLLAPYPSLFFDQPPSPTDTCTSFASSSTSGSPPPRATHVVCNAPLVAPIPLPYHSPTFLQFELLPDIDEDLSHPPYTTRSRTAALKRKRTEDETRQEHAQKRRLSVPARQTQTHMQTGHRTRSSVRVLPYQPRR